MKKIIENKEFERYPTKLEKLNLFLLGCLSNMSSPNSNQKLTIDERCENESKIILKTFNNIYPYFETLNMDSESLHRQIRRNAEHSISLIYKKSGIDYSPLIICLCKVFEIETNLSLVHWYRKILNIEMPTYFKKHKDDDTEYTITPLESITEHPEPIDFNLGFGSKWLAPGIGKSELVTRTFHTQGKLPNEISNYDELLENWKILRKLRNKAAHTENMNIIDFNNVFSAFNNVIENDFFKQMNDLKMTLKQ